MDGLQHAPVVQPLTLIGHYYYGVYAWVFRRKHDLLRRNNRSFLKEGGTMTEQFAYYEKKKN